MPCSFVSEGMTVDDLDLPFDPVDRADNTAEMTTKPKPRRRPKKKQKAPVDSAEENGNNSAVYMFTMYVVMVCVWVLGGGGVIHMEYNSTVLKDILSWNPDVAYVACSGK